MIEYNSLEGNLNFLGAIIRLPFPLFSVSALLRQKKSSTQVGARFSRSNRAF